MLPSKNPERLINENVMVSKRQITELSQTFKNKLHNEKTKNVLQ